MDLSVEAADWGQELEYSEDAAAHPNYQNCLIQTEDDYEKIQVLNPRETPRMSEHIELARILAEKKGKEMPIVGFVFGPIGILSMMRGQDNLYVDLMICPEKIKPALKNIMRQGWLADDGFLVAEVEKGLPLRADAQYDLRLEAERLYGNTRILVWVKNA